MVTLDSFSPTELLDFGCGWSPLGSRGEPWADNPERQARERWATWQEFLSDWEQVRDEWRASESMVFGPACDECFAEWLYQRYGLEGPPEMPIPASPYPAVIPTHPVIERWREDRDRLARLPRGGQRP